MRISHSKSSRPVANRRAYRPDRQVYRQLRRGMRRKWSWMTWVEIAIVVLMLAGIVWVVLWAIA